MGRESAGESIDTAVSVAKREPAGSEIAAVVGDEHVAAPGMASAR